jgi:hypothetical protein
MLALETGVDPHPAQYGTTRLFQFNSKQGIRTAVSNARVADSVVIAERLALGTKQLGATDVGAGIGRSFWVAFPAAMYSATDFDIIFDDRDNVGLPHPSVFANHGLNPLTVAGPTVLCDATNSQGFVDFADTFMATSVATGTAAGGIHGTFGPGGYLMYYYPTNDYGLITGPAAYGLPIELLMPSASYMPFELSMMELYTKSTVAQGDGTSKRNWSIQALTTRAQLKAADMTALYGWTTAMWGVTFTYGARLETFTHPGVANCLPVPGLYMNGVHRNVKSFSVRAGVVTKIVTELTGEALGAFVASMAAYAPTSSAAAIAATAFALSTGYAGKRVRFLHHAAPVGPYDIYLSKVIVDAIADGATLDDINGTDVSGTMAGVWRTRGNAAAPTPDVGYVVQNRTTLRPTLTPTYVTGTTASLSPIPTGSTLYQILDPANGYGGGAGHWASRADMLTAVENSYPGVNTVNRGQSLVFNRNSRAVNDPKEDMPYVWWQSLGFASISGVLSSIRQSVLVPLKGTV